MWFGIFGLVWVCGLFGVGYVWWGVWCLCFVLDCLRCVCDFVVCAVCYCLSLLVWLLIVLFIDTRSGVSFCSLFGDFVLNFVLCYWYCCYGWCLLLCDICLFVIVVLFGLVVWVGCWCIRCGLMHFYYAVFWWFCVVWLLPSGGGCCWFRCWLVHDYGCCLWVYSLFVVVSRWLVVCCVWWVLLVLILVAVG